MNSIQATVRSRAAGGSRKRLWSGLIIGMGLALSGHAAEWAGARPLRDLNKSYFPFTPVESAAEWPARRQEIERRVLVSVGLWPMPEKTPLNAVVHGRVEGDGYTVDRVFFESLPGHFVTGSLYRPKNPPAKMPAVLSPHGHWPNGRFMRATDTAVRRELAIGAERFENAARSPMQARCVQLARMGCAVFLFDTLGNADSVQFTEHRHGPADRGFVSPEAEAHLVGYLGLQTWNGLRALDFLLSLPGIDLTRVGCTGASGGGTQTMILAGIDQRITAAFPCVMVSTAMQGGCTCENSHHLRIGQGNIDIAALTAPRPLGLTTANDWTKELDVKGFPDLKQLYTMLGHPNRVTALFAPHFSHNYNHVSRGAMYTFFNEHFQLGAEAPVLERDFELLDREQLTVWNEHYPRPTGNQVGTPHEEAVLAWFKAQAARPGRRPDLEVAQGAWETLVGRTLPARGTAQFDLETKTDQGEQVFLKGTVRYGDEQVACAFLYPRTWNKQVVLWLSLQGGRALCDDQGRPTAEGRRLLQAGYALAVPQLYEAAACRNPNVYSYRDLATFFGYSGYHYGYNPSLLAERVRDALSVLAVIRDDERYPVQGVVVAGSEGAGAIAAATTALARSLVKRAVVHTEGFRFAQLKDVWDHRFVPGAVKYGDVEGLLALCAPVALTVQGETEVGLGAVRATYAERGGTLTVAGGPGITETLLGGR